MALVDQFIPDAGRPGALGDLTCLGAPARLRFATPPPATLPTRRIRACWPDTWYLGYLGSAAVPVHGPHPSTRLGPVGREWNHGRGCMGRVLLPTLHRHCLQPRKGLARLPKTGVPCIQHGCCD